MPAVSLIKLRFVGGNDLISKGISAAEYGFWAIHAEAVMPDGTWLGAHYDGGVQARPAGYDKATCTQDMIVSIPVEAAMADKFHAFLRSQIGKPYDIEAIVAFVARRDWQSPDSWFCSELQAAALAHCGWFASALATQFNHITPRDLLLIVSGRVNIQGAA
jgi:hypothetical protein